MIPILIVTHTASGTTDLSQGADMRKLRAPFHFQVCDSQDHDQVYKSNSGFLTYDDARTAGVVAVDWVLKSGSGTVPE